VKTTDLIRWAYQLANGMEYLARKKARNETFVCFFVYSGRFTMETVYAGCAWRFGVEKSTFRSKSESKNNRFRPFHPFI